MEKKECIVYLEDYYKKEDGSAVAYVDFRQLKDFYLYCDEVNNQNGNDVIIDKNSQATIFELNNLKTGKRLRRGCYYKLNLDLIKNYQIENNQDSAIIGGSYNLDTMQMPEGEHDEVLQSHEILDPMELSEQNVPAGIELDVNDPTDLTLFVKDVGQANWNELRSGDAVKIVYDAGAEKHASKNTVNSIIASRKKDLERSKPVLVISHWDLDHIHCLSVMAENDLSSCFSKIVCPDKLKSATSKRVLDKIRIALGNDNVYCLPSPVRTNGITMHLWRREGVVSIYRAENSSQINYSGLVMFVRGTKRSANYTGDCKLIQANDVHDQERKFGLNTNEHVLIAPHHGGKTSDVADRLYSIPCDLIKISVGANNPYGHPYPVMLRYLQSLGNVKQTKNVGDILEPL